jgi:pyruvate dehydrogenase E2 component (dihydrolipoamide acetyltransferase)
MAEITMPKLSDTMTEGVVVRWHKKKGEPVSTGDVLAEIETDKATMEMEAFDDGVLEEVYAQEGQKVSVGEPIALIGAGPAAPSSEMKPESHEQQAKAPRSKDEAPKTAPASTNPQPEQRSQEKASAGNRDNETRVKASPLARKTASRLNLDLAQVTGSGPGGRIVQQDVLSLSKEGSTAGDTAGIVSTADSELIPLTPMRRIIAQRMTESKSQIPHFYLSVELAVEAVLKLRSEANEALARGGQQKLSINDFILKATAECLQIVPQVNSSYTTEGIRRFKSVHLGFAVALDEGLITPVIRNAESKSLRQISREAREFTERARAKKLKPDEYQGGSFTVSNLGAAGIDSFLAIINPPQSGILAVGSVVKKPVVNGQDQIVIGQRLNVTLCCDHRVVDGAVGAVFLQEFRKLIENPTLMLI